jgi:hypothetical protein
VSSSSNVTVALICFAPKVRPVMVLILSLTTLMPQIFTQPFIITLLGSMKPMKQERCGHGSKFIFDSLFFSSHDYLILSYGTYLGEIPEAPETFNVVGNINEYGRFIISSPFSSPSTFHHLALRFDHW